HPQAVHDAVPDRRPPHALPERVRHPPPRRARVARPPLAAGTQPQAVRGLLRGRPARRHLRHRPSAAVRRHAGGTGPAAGSGPGGRRRQLQHPAGTGLRLRDPQGVRLAGVPRGVDPQPGRLHPPPAAPLGRSAPYGRSAPLGRPASLGRPAPLGRLTSRVPPRPPPSGKGARPTGQTWEPTSRPMPYVTPMAASPPTTTRATARRLLAPPTWAETEPVTIRASTTAPTVDGTATDRGVSRIASRGTSPPTRKASIDDSPACHGLTSSCGSMPRWRRACAVSASF